MVIPYIAYLRIVAVAEAEAEAEADGARQGRFDINGIVMGASRYEGQLLNLLSLFILFSFQLFFTFSFFHYQGEEKGFYRYPYKPKLDPLHQLHLLPWTHMINNIQGAHARPNLCLWPVSW